MHQYAVTEVFRSVQGEGYHTGRLTTFVRFDRCNLDCVWCDTPGSLTNRPEHVSAMLLTLDDLVQLVLQEETPDVCITGGEPMFRPHEQLQALTQRLTQAGKHVTIETNGTILPLLDLDVQFWSVSPKLASALVRPWQSYAKILHRFCDEVFATCEGQFKLVIGSGEDLEDAYLFMEEFKKAPAFVLVPCAPHMTGSELYDILNWSRVPAEKTRLMLQQHKVMNLR